MLEMAFLRIPFLVGKAANLLQNGKIMSGSIDCMAFLFRDECLVVVDELFGQLSES